MKLTINRNVHPAASAVLILLVLGGVQMVWWRFLVYREPPKKPGQGGGGGGAGPREVTLVGRPDVVVDMFSGDQDPGDVDGPGHAARLDRPTGLALNASGDLFVADTGNHRIRRIGPTGETATLAGSDRGYADGPALSAKFNAPCGVCVGPDDSVYVADTGNHCIRRIQGGQVTTLKFSSTASGATGSPTPTTTLLPTGIAYVPGPKPFLLVADAAGKALRHVGIDGGVEGEQKIDGRPVSVVGTPLAATSPDAGTLLLEARTLKGVPIDASDAGATPAQQAKLTLRHPLGVCQAGTGWLATDDGFGAVLLIVNGKAQVVAGYCSSAGPIRGFRDGDGAHSMFGTLCGVVSDGKRYAYVADTAYNTIRRLDISALTGH